MKNLLFGLILLFTPFVSNAADIEIWMMHDHNCGFCYEFLNDMNIEEPYEGKHTLIYKNEAREDVEVDLYVVDAYADTVPLDFSLMLIYLEKFQWTPWFYRADPNTGEISNWKAGWSKKDKREEAFKARFREWVLYGGDVNRVP